MRVIATTGRDDLARVYIAASDSGRHVEFVESLQPPRPREDKWVLIVSCLFGCPFSCRFCDAGGKYLGPLSREEIEFQIDYLVKKRFPGGVVPCKKFKVQFARMGEPALNPAVLDVIAALPSRLEAPGLIVSLSTIAPAGCEGFFGRLLEIKESFRPGSFQFQFSLHSSDEGRRRELVPAPTWSFAAMAAYGRRFFRPGDRKVTLSFALAEGYPLDAERLLPLFEPELFLVKITPVNPTLRARENGLRPVFGREDGDARIVERLRRAGYEVIVSIGELEENAIGSNCGQFVRSYLEGKSDRPKGKSYSYRLETLPPND
ncbi:MAG: radical SAM protein [Candidatus Aminicenantes bacterium]|nr:radical SAM protein [Candidatus Aminicenantes bacterium]